MNLKAIAAASVIALAPAVSSAAILVDVDNPPFFQTILADSIGGSIVEAGGAGAEFDGTANVIGTGIANAQLWEVNAFNTLGPPTDGVLTFDFDINGDADDVSVTSTQNPLGQLANLTLTLLIDNVVVSTSGYSPSFAQVAAGGVVNDASTVTVQVEWTGFLGPAAFANLDFIISADPFSGGNQVPLPASAMLLVGALGGLGYFARKRG